MDSIPWQVRIARKSLKKRQKICLLEKSLPFDPDRKALEIGCAQGTLGYFLRRRGGFWASADEDWPNLKSSQSLLGRSLVQMPRGILPARSGAFDLVTCLDYLEHIENDDACLLDSNRVLKKGGELIVVTPHTGRYFILHRLRRALGMKLEFYGHKREGYGLRELVDKLEKAGFEVIRSKTYSRFFSEFCELALNFIFIKIKTGKVPPEKLRDGHIKPATEEEFRARAGVLRIYFFFYPLVWLVSRLDAFLFFLRGYSLIIWAKKP